MPGKLNQTALKDYSDQFTSKVLADFYQTRTVINGQQLLTLTPSRQVNLGIINRLFDQWKGDAQAFRSPYFDFENEEVVGAMQEFMNTVSRHIAIKRNDLQPLLLESTTQALLLLLAPGEYFENRLRSLPNFTFDVGTSRTLTKYTHIHAAVAKTLALRLTDSGSDFVFVNQALNWLSEIVNGGASLDEITPYVKEFSSVVAMDVVSIAPEATPRSTPAIPSTQQFENKSFFDTDLSDAPAPAVQPVPSDSRSVSPLPTVHTSHMLVTTVESASLNNHYKVDKPLEETTYGNIAVKVDSILKSIALGHRFMFVNQLFDRNSDAFDEAMRELDQADDYDEAKALISDKFAAQYSWDMKSEAVGDLLAIVKRKFN